MSEKKEEMVKEVSWEEFRSTGLLWWGNSLLHMFGFSICYEYDDYGNIARVYPARVKFRGFDNEVTSDGYAQVSRYMESNCKELLKESLE